METLMQRVPPGESNEPLPHPLVALARRYFAGYYARADVNETRWMDALILTRTELLQSLERPREDLSAEVRSGLERRSDSIERLFTELRERVRQSAAFAALSAADRERVERDAFEIGKTRFG